MKKLLIILLSTVLVSSAFGFSVVNQTTYVVRVTANFDKANPDANWFEYLLGFGRLSSTKTLTIAPMNVREDLSGQNYEIANYTVLILNSNGNDIYAGHFIKNAPVDKAIMIHEDTAGNITFS